MTKLEFPGEKLPAQPALTLAIPDDLSPMPSPGVVVAR